ELPAQHCKADLADRVVRLDRRPAQALGLGAPVADGREAGLVLAEHGRPEPASPLHALDERPDGVERRLRHLDPDAPQTAPDPSTRLPDRRLVEQELAARRSLRLERERAPAGLELEERPPRGAAGAGAGTPP